MKSNYVNSILIFIAIIIATFYISDAYRAKFKAKEIISVTGLGEKSFTSDLIVWEGYFTRENKDLKQAYVELDNDKKVIEEYLNSNGVNPNEIVFKAVEIQEKRKGKYSNDGRYIQDEFEGYMLTVPIQISSKEVEKIENISRKITELLNMGIHFYSSTPRYYYTKLADLKIELLSKATEDARLRAETIAKMSGVQLGKLCNAQMGIFQITGENSDEDYSWGGTFNTSSKEKKASITIKLNYKIK
ncbi:MAG TPA: SIMPL domain-containing protein [Bacteroidales bacterium]|nr:SIMPL domain-containing protein [Bacteroidales bacterium]